MCNSHESLRRCLRAGFLILTTLLIVVQSAGTALATGKLLSWGKQITIGANEMAGLRSIHAQRDVSLGVRVDGSTVFWGGQAGFYGTPPDNIAGFRQILLHGAGTALCVTASGSIIGWGQNSTGMLDIPAPNSDFDSIAASRGGRMIGLKANGTVVEWGGWPLAPAVNADFVSVAKSDQFSLGVKTNGTIVHWGNSIYGTANLPTPNSGFVSVYVERNACFAIRNDGTAAAWGTGNLGELDIPSTTKKFKKIFLAEPGVCIGLMEDGSLLEWGNIRPDHAGTEPDSGFVDIKFGNSSVLGLRIDGSLASWGDNNFGQCDFPLNGGPYTAIASGQNHCMALRADGHVDAWGDNSTGQRGVPGGNFGITKAACEDLAFLALKADSTVAAWSVDLGSGLLPSPNEGFIDIAINSYRYLAVRADGSIISWHDDEGVPLWVNQFVPPVPNSGFVAIHSAQFSGAVGRRADGSMEYLYDDGWSFTIPEPNIDYVKYSGEGYGLFLRADGTVAAAPHILADLPGPNAGFVDIAASVDFYLALRDNGTIEAWGDTTFGQIDVPEPNTDFVAIAAGYHHAVGLKSDGSIVAWGDNSNGQIPQPVNNSDFVAIGASEGLTYAIKGDALAAVGGAPSILAAGRNHPNPFNPSTTISFALPSDGPMRLEIYDSRGRLVRVLADGHQSAGPQSVVWNGMDDAGQSAPSGVYIYRLTAGGLSRASKMTLVR